MKSNRRGFFKHIGLMAGVILAGDKIEKINADIVSEGSETEPIHRVISYTAATMAACCVEYVDQGNVYFGHEKD